MADFPAMPFYTDAYLGDTLHLTLEEHGAYLKLLIIAWRSPDNAIPDDDRRIATMLGITPRKWQVIKPTVMSFWSLRDGFWRQKKLEKVREKVRNNVRQKREAAEARWSDKSLENKESDNADAQPSAHAGGRAAGMLTKTITKTITKPKEEYTSADADSAVSLYNDFAEQEGLPKVQKLTAKRKRYLFARLRDCGGLDGWRGALEKARASPFLMGDNDRKWKMDFDFLVQERSFTKLMEGSYERASKDKLSSGLAGAFAD